jgi:hypothetical protein
LLSVIHLNNSDRPPAEPTGMSNPAVHRGKANLVEMIGGKSPITKAHRF